MERHHLLSVLAGALAVVALVSLLTPWWTIDATMTGPFSVFGDMANAADASAGPFDNGGDMIGDGQAVLAGVLVLLALIAAAGAAIAAAMAYSKVAGLAAACSGSLLLLTCLLALLTWPDGSMDFWDSQSSSADGFRFEATTAAGFGWYAALVGVALSAFVAIRGLTAPGRAAASTRPAATEATAAAATVAPASLPPASAPATGGPAAGDRCTATTKAGARCARRATQGAVCGIHV